MRSRLPEVTDSLRRARVGRVATLAGVFALFAGTAHAQEPIEEAREALAQPGPEARPQREQAVDALLLMSESAAHQVLRDVVRAGDDADGVAAFVLESLSRRWSQRADPVFGTDDPERRRRLLRVHVPAVIWNAGTSNPLREPALECLRALQSGERLALFQELLQSDDSEIVARALAAAARCRDLGLAPPIAALLEHSDHGEVAGEALATLTFAADPFRTLAEFEAWQQDNRGVRYITLAERAGRAAREALRTMAAEHDTELRAKVVRLIVAMLRAERVDWLAVQRELLADDPPGLLRAALAEIRGELAKGRDFGGLAPDRLALANELEKRLANARNPGEEAELLEVVARLRVIGDEGVERAMVDRLRAALERSEPVVRRAALRALAAYPSPVSRSSALAAAQAALAKSDEQAVVAEALRCLSASGQLAPSEQDADRVAWRALLERVLGDTSLPAALKSAATEVAILKDRSGKRSPIGSELLQAAVDDVQQPALFRKQAMIRWRLFTEDAALAERFVVTLCGRLSDPDPVVRAAAAEQLQRVPEGAGTQQRAKWIEKVRNHAAPRLLEENDRTAFEFIVSCLRASAEPPGDAGAAIGRFVDAALRISGEAPATGPEENPGDGPRTNGGETPSGSDESALAGVRRQLVGESLQLLGGSPGRSSGEWIAAGRALAALRNREGLRSVLVRQKASMALDDTASPDTRAVATLIVAAALLAPEEPDWSSRRGEAQEVERALAVLEASDGWIASPAHRKLQVHVLLGQGKYSTAARVGAEALSATDVQLQGPDRAEVLLAVTTAETRSAAWESAEQRLRELQGIGGSGLSEAIQQLWLDIASGYLEAGTFDRALAAAGEASSRATEGTALWARGFLVRQEARFRSDPATFRTVVERELRAQAAWFTADGAPEALRTRFERLTTEVQDG